MKKWRCSFCQKVNPNETTRMDPDTYEDYCECGKKRGNCPMCDSPHCPHGSDHDEDLEEDVDQDNQAQTSSGQHQD